MNLYDLTGDPTKAKQNIDAYPDAPNIDTEKYKFHPVQPTGEPIGELPQPEVQPEQKPIVPQSGTPEYVDWLEKRSGEHNNFLNAILENANPQIDPEKEKRYKQRAAINALGDGLKQIFNGVQMKQGLNIQPDPMAQTAYANEAYQKLLDDNQAKQEQYKNLVMQGKMSGLTYREHLQNLQDQMDFRREQLKSREKIESSKIEARKSDAGKTRGLTAEQRIAVDDNLYNNKKELALLNSKRYRELEGLRQSGKISLAEFNAQVRREIENIKNNTVTTTTETPDSDKGTTTKVTTKKTLEPPTTPTTKTAPTPTETEEQKAKRLGFKPKGSLKRGN